MKYHQTKRGFIIMQLSHILKRLVPFLGAVLLGVFVSGLFFTAPASGEPGSRAYEELRRENARLKTENCRLKREVRKVRKAEFIFEDKMSIPAVPEPPMPPAPPMPPVAPAPPASR